MKKRMHVFFSGTVQGVGFRFTVERISRHFDATGFVRNVPDGRVELVAEGEETVLQDFLKAIQNSPMASYIRDADVKWLSAQNTFTCFEITG